MSIGIVRLHTGVVLAVALLPSWALALSCLEYRSDYVVKDGAVVFSAYPPAIKRRVENFDSSSLQLVHPPGYGAGPCSTFINDYASDGHRVFYRGELIEGAQRKGFRILGDGYAADENAVYGRTARISERVSDFKKVGTLATDGVAVFYQDRRLKGANLESPSGLPRIYRTSAAVYDAQGEEIDADPATVLALIPSNELWRDQTKVFLRSKVIHGADPDTFESIGNYFYRDKRAVYLMDREIPGMNPRTARQFKHQELYSTDGNAVYKRYDRLNRDPETFTAEMQSWYTKDKNGVYHQDVLIKDADVATFEATALEMARDKNYDYRGNTMVCARREGLKPGIERCKP